MHTSTTLPLLLFSLFAVGCGEANVFDNTSGPSRLKAPPIMLPAADGGNVKFGPLTADNPRYSCPTGAPTFILDAHGAVDMSSNRATFRLTDERVEHYQYVLERRDSDTNLWFPVGSPVVTERTTFDVVLYAAGLYRLQVRSQSCNLSGPWVTSPTFGTETEDGQGVIDPLEPPITLPEPPVEPPNHCTSPYTPGCYGNPPIDDEHHGGGGHKPPHHGGGGRGGNNGHH